MLNFADLARAVDVDQKTVKAWLSILETSGLLYLLAPWHSNLTKRLVETPKLYVPRYRPVRQSAHLFFWLGTVH